MRHSLRLGSRKPMNREWALASLATNVALPGAGTLLIGRVTGYLQMAVALGGVGLTLVYGVGFIRWFLENRLVLMSPDQEPFVNLGVVWMQLRMPLLGFALFAGGWVWSVISSLLLLWKSLRSGSLPTDGKSPGAD